MRVVQKSKTQKRQQQGFTLVELLIVVVVIGLLAAMALPKFGTFTQEARLSANQYQSSSQGSQTACREAANSAGKNASDLCGTNSSTYGGSGVQ